MKSNNFKNKISFRAAGAAVNSASMNNRAARGQRGAAMIMDIIIWAGGALLVVGFVMGLAKLITPPLNGWREASAVASHIKLIENNYGGSSGYTGLSNASVAVVNAGIFQPKYLPGGDVINNIFRGTVTVGFTTNRVTADTLQYTDTNIPSGACRMMASTLADDVDKITIAGQVVKEFNGVYNATLATTQCNSAVEVTILAEKIKAN